MKTRTVAIYGELVGRIWMPSVVCWKPVSVTMRDDEDLRELLIRATTDGDFQSCGLAPGAMLEVTYTERSEGGTIRNRSRSWELRFKCWETEDLAADPEDVLEYEQGAGVA